MIDEALLLWAEAESEPLNASVLHSIAPTLDFFRRHATGSDFYKRAEFVGSKDTLGPTVVSQQVRVQLAQLLLSWVAFARAGLATALPFEAQARVEAATDLMEQVQRLLDDHATHVAAPVVLAGAALEEFLRSMMVGCSEPLPAKPSLSAYAAALRKGKLLTKNDEKDITAWAGHRNEAAHGVFDDLSTARARLMVDGINFFISRHLA